MTETQQTIQRVLEALSSYSAIEGDNLSRFEKLRDRHAAKLRGVTPVQLWHILRWIYRAVLRIEVWFENGEIEMETALLKHIRDAKIALELGDISRALGTLRILVAWYDSMNIAPVISAGGLEATPAMSSWGSPMSWAIREAISNLEATG